MSTLTLTQQAAPSTPVAGKAIVYVKADGILYTKNAAGIETSWASLDGGGKVPASQLPSIAVTDTFVVASQAAQVALTAQVGDVAVRTDQNKSYILVTEPASVFANWQVLLSPPNLILVPYTVATLPPGTVGDRAYVTDATAPAWNTALTGGGAVVVPVFRNATVWVSA